MVDEESSGKKLTYTRHLIRQPAAATFSRWRRLSFVSALYVNEQCGGNHCIMVAPRIQITDKGIRTRVLTLLSSLQEVASVVEYRSKKE